MCDCASVLRMGPLLVVAWAAAAWAADPFPGELPGVEIGQNLPGSYEPSGVAWHTRLEVLFLVSDGGSVTHMERDGSNAVTVSVGGDLEGICVAHAASEFVYLGVENPDSIREFNFVTNTVTRTFDLTDYMTGPSNNGLEALTFIPDDGHPEGGLFCAGLQSDGLIYVFELPILSSQTSEDVTFLGTITPVAGRTDLSGLHYAADVETLYAIWDTSNLVRAMDSSGTFLAEWELPGNDQEGVVTVGCELFVAEDVGPEVWRYDFPVMGCVTWGLGDLNCDGVLNNFDVDAFVLALTDASGYATAYPDCDRTRADCNEDGSINNFDIDPFVAMLAQ